MKIQACKDYDSGKGSFRSIAKEIGAYYKTISEWYYVYKNHGEAAFNESTRNKAYTKEFKEFLIKKYLSHMIVALRREKLYSY